MARIKFWVDWTVLMDSLCFSFVMEHNARLSFESCWYIVVVGLWYHISEVWNLLLKKLWGLESRKFCKRWCWLLILETWVPSNTKNYNWFILFLSPIELCLWALLNSPHFSLEVQGSRWCFCLSLLLCSKNPIKWRYFSCITTLTNLLCISLTKHWVALPKNRHQSYCTHIVFCCYGDDDTNEVGLKCSTLYTTTNPLIDQVFS